MYNTIFVGDLHIRKEQWARDGVEGTLDEIMRICGTRKDIDEVFFLGDVFNQSRPYPEEIRIFSEFLSNMGTHITVLAGNHEYLETRDSYAEDALVREESFDFIESPCIRDFGNYRVVCLPYLPIHRLNQLGCNTMSEYYEDKYLKFISSTEDKEDLKKKTVIVYHFEDETQSFGSGVDLRGYDRLFPNSTRIGGHIHNQVKNYIGTPYQTRADESENDAGVLYLYNGELTKVRLPFFVKFESVQYGKEVERPEENTHLMLRILDAPSYDAVVSKYGKIPNSEIYDYEVVSAEERSIDTGKREDKTILQMLDDFIRDNHVRKDVSDYLNTVMR